jgi:hypothetical protein
MSQEMIVKRLGIMDQLQQELNKLRTHYEETLENDPQYQKFQEEHEKVKSEASQSKEKQEKIMETPSYKAISDQIKEKRTELKEHKEALAQELIEYYRENGTMEIEDSEGNVKRMKFSVKLVN